MAESVLSENIKNSPLTSSLARMKTTWPKHKNLLNLDWQSWKNFVSYRWCQLRSRCLFNLRMERYRDTSFCSELYDQIRFFEGKTWSCTRKLSKVRRDHYEWDVPWRYHWSNGSRKRASSHSRSHRKGCSPRRYDNWILKCFFLKVN